MKREVIHKVIHPESIPKMLHIFGILTDHIATSQLNTINSQVTGDYMILMNAKKNDNDVKIGSNCATYHTPTVNISNFLDNILKFRS